MPYYEFECPKGHVTEAVVPMGTKTWPCDACKAETEAQMARFDRRHASPPGSGVRVTTTLAKRILSPTRTTFVHADTGKRIKHIKKVAARGH